MRFASVCVLATLAGLTLAQTDCSQSPTNFQIYENGTEFYGALGHPCRTAFCGVFFSETVDTVTTYYNIADNGNLVINSATSGPDNNPTRPNGFIAFTFSTGSKAVEFGSKHYIKNRSDTLRLIKCSIEDSSDGDGTCDLVCSAKAQGGTTGSSVLTRNYDQWYMGNGGNKAITVKVAFST